MGHTITFRAHRTNVARRRRLDVETLSTTELLRLHERHFGPLDSRSKARIVELAVSRGWERRWDLDGLAA